MTTTDVNEATKGVDYAIMVGGFPRKAGMERKDVMAKNVSIYKSQASALEKNANKGVKASRLLSLLGHASGCKGTALALDEQRECCRL